MSSLIISSKCVEIENNSIGIVVIKNVRRIVNEESLPILFKVKTNLKEMVDVRPSFGVLWSQSDMASAALNVKYTGLREQIDKAKLMISWISTSDKIIYENKKPNHDQFNNLFRTAKKVNEGSLLLPIVYKESAEKMRNDLNQSQEAQSRSNEETAPIVNVQPQRFNPPQQTKAQSIPLKQSKLEAEFPKQTVNVAEKIEKPRNQGYSMIVVGLALIIAFILGVSVGIKIERYVQPYINQFEHLVNGYIESYTQSQTKVTHQLDMLQPSEGLQTAQIIPPKGDEDVDVIEQVEVVEVVEVVDN